MFKSLIHFELIFVYGVKNGLISFFTCSCSFFPAPFVQETFFPTLCRLLSFVRFIDHRLMGLFLGFLSCSIDLKFLLLCQHNIVLMTAGCRIVWGQEAWFLQPHFSFSSLLWLFMAFCVPTQILRFFCSSSVKNAIGNLIGIALNL